MIKSELFTKELGGTLLIVTPDNRTFELYRGNHSDNIHIRTDEGDKYTPEEEKIFRELWRDSNCKLI